jgi:hypothetical protein
MMGTLDSFEGPAVIQNNPFDFLKLHSLIIRTMRIKCQEEVFVKFFEIFLLPRLSSPVCSAVSNSLRTRGMKTKSSVYFLIL